MGYFCYKTLSPCKKISENIFNEYVVTRRNVQKRFNGMLFSTFPVIRLILLANFLARLCYFNTITFYEND